MKRTTQELPELERYLHERIPLTRAMGVRVVADTPANAFVLEAPVAMNSNHLGTAFGASIYGVATLAGYGFLWLELREESAHVLIASSSIRYLKPIREIIRAHCLPPPSAALEKFKNTLRAKGHARIELRVCVEENGEATAEFEAAFVAQRIKK